MRHIVPRPLVALEVVLLTLGLLSSVAVSVCGGDRDGKFEYLTEETIGGVEYLVYKASDPDGVWKVELFGKHKEGGGYTVRESWDRPPDSEGKGKDKVIYCWLKKYHAGQHDHKVQLYDDRGRIDSAWELLASSPKKPSEYRLFTPSQAGGDPPIWQNIMAFPTPETFLGRDLNGDGDTGDTVLRYMNIETGEVVNTGAVVSGLTRTISVYEDVIAFVGANRLIRYYGVSKGGFGEVGVEGSHPSVYGDMLVFSSDDLIVCYDLRTGTFLDLELLGSSPTIHGTIIAFHSAGTLWYHNLATGTTVNTGVVAVDPYLYGEVIAFVMQEHHLQEDLNGDGDRFDWVVGYYSLRTGKAVSTGADGFLPSVYGNTIVFSTDELSVGQDLNGDGKILGSVIRYYDVTTGEVVNTGILGTEPAIYEGTITYYVWEHWIGQDLTADGDAKDPVVGYFWISSKTLVRLESPDSDGE